MIKNLFCHDSDFLTGRRLQRNQHSGHQKISDRPQHLSKAPKSTNKFCYTKVLQKKCLDIDNQVKFTLFNKPKNSRLTLEPNLDILNNRKDYQCKINLGIFSNTKSTDIGLIPKSKSTSEKNKSIKKLTTKIEPNHDFPNSIILSEDNYQNNLEDIAHFPINNQDESSYNQPSLDQSLGPRPKTPDMMNDSIMFDIENDESISLDLIKEVSKNEKIPTVPSSLQTTCVHDKDIFTDIYIQRYKDEYFQCPESINKKRIHEISQSLFLKK